MTSTTESTNETSTGTTTKDSAFGFLIELTKTPFLFFFFAGLACLVFGISGNIPGIGKVPSWGIPISIFTGVVLMFVPFRDYRRSIRIREQRDTYKENYDKLFRQWEVEQASLDELNEAVTKALELLEMKDERDQVDSEVLQILREKTARLLVDLQGSANQKLVSDWLNKDRQVRLVNSLKNLDYTFLSNNSESEQFFIDIEAHLELLSKNLRNGGYRSPKVDNLEKSLDDSFAYVRAFKDLKIQILSEAEDDRDTLTASGIDYLRRHIDTFIKIVND